MESLYLNKNSNIYASNKDLLKNIGNRSSKKLISRIKNQNNFIQFNSFNINTNENNNSNGNNKKLSIFLSN